MSRDFNDHTADLLSLAQKVLRGPDGQRAALESDARKHALGLYICITRLSLLGIAHLERETQRKVFRFLEELPEGYIYVRPFKARMTTEEWEYFSSAMTNASKEIERERPTLCIARTNMKQES